MKTFKKIEPKHEILVYIYILSVVTLDETNISGCFWPLAFLNAKH